jgi:hypothetical protein
MPKPHIGHKPNFLRFKRTKPGIGAENHATTGRRFSTNRRSIQFGFGTCSSGTLVHAIDPTLVYSD